MKQYDVFSYFDLKNIYQNFGEVINVLLVKVTFCALRGQYGKILIFLCVYFAIYSVIKNNVVGKLHNKFYLDFLPNAEYNLSSQILAVITDLYRTLKFIVIV